MARKSVFINNIKSQNDLGCYVWGANGELAATLKNVKNFIYDHETSTDNAATAYALYYKRKADKDLRLMDCSGLIVYGLRSSGAKASNFDTTAEGLRFRYCRAIDKKELIPGDLCFKMSDGKANHVGLYIGNNKVIESRGRKWGVVTRSITLGGWSRYGRLDIKWEDEPTKYVLTRILKKGCKGSDVEVLQEKLNKLGYNCGEVDRVFGSKTKSAVQQLQRNTGLKADGIVGKDTCGKLGWIWQG